jgi:acyl-CoA thioesterase-1
MLRASLLLASACLVAVSTGASCGRGSEPSSTPVSGEPLKDRVITYVALGDSTGVGVGAGRERGYVDRLAARLGAKGARVELLNLCQSGGNTEDILAGALARAVAARPSVVTLGIGVNDLVHGVPVERFAANLDRIATALGALDVPVLVVNLPDLSLSPAAVAFSREMVLARVRAFNLAVAEVTRRHRLVAFDLFTRSQQSIPDNPALFSVDGFHPSGAGYEAWAQMMWPTLERALVHP